MAPVFDTACLPPARVSPPDPPLDALGPDLDVILILASLHGQQTDDCGHFGKIDDFARRGRKYRRLANSEFMAHRRGGLSANLEING